MTRGWSSVEDIGVLLTFIVFLGKSWPSNPIMLNFVMFITSCSVEHGYYLGAIIDALSVAEKPGSTKR